MAHEVQYTELDAPNTVLYMPVRQVVHTAAAVKTEL